MLGTGGKEDVMVNDHEPETDRERRDYNFRFGPFTREADMPTLQCILPAVNFPKFSCARNYRDDPHDECKEGAC